MTNTTTDTHARLRRLRCRQLPFDELARNHRQAQMCVEAALRHGEGDLYRQAQRVEDAHRLEMVRRQRDRETPDVGVRIDGWR